MTSVVMEAKMATKVTVELEDDLDGGPAAETVRFEIDGSQYEMDLNKKNARTRAASPVRAYLIKPSAQRRRPGVGERPGHPGQRTRAHPCERCGAVRIRYGRILTQVQTMRR